MLIAEALKVTADDYRLMPEGGPRYQLIGGELFMSPSPSRYHQSVVSNIYFLIRGFIEVNPLGRVYMAPLDVHLSEHDVFQPDLLFVSNAHAAIQVDEGIHGAPDLAVEVLSPSTARIDKEPKRKTYAAQGVEELWLVDPKSRTTTVYQLQESPDRPTAVHAESDTFQSPLFPGLEISGDATFKD
jgi:Uma2 family endonuclease